MPPIIGKSNGPLQPYWTTADGLSVKLYRGHVLDTLNRLPRRSVHTVITSPPYWGLRDYGTGQWEGGRKDCDHVERMIDLSASTMRGENPVGMHEKKAQVGHQYKSQCGKCGARRIDSQLGSESMPDCLGWARGVNCADSDSWVGGLVGCKHTNTETVQLYRGVGTEWEGGDPRCSHTRLVGARSHDATKPKDGHKSGFRGSVQLTDHRQEPLKSAVCPRCGAHRKPSLTDCTQCVDCGTIKGNWQTGCHVCRMVLVFRSVRRILRDDGTLWLNYGDTYSAGSYGESRTKETVSDAVIGKDGVFQRRVGRQCNDGNFHVASDTGLKSGNLIGIPWRVAFALQADGWILRSDIPWLKRSAMPESASNRPCKALEYVFLFAKQGGYYFDMEAVRKPLSGPLHTPGNKKTYEAGGHACREDRVDKVWGNDSGRAFRNADLWFESVKSPHGLTGVGDELVGIDCTSEAYPGAHYATFPSKLITPFILVGTSEYGCCANCGTPWRRVVGREVPTDYGRGNSSWSAGSAVGTPQRDALGPCGNGLGVKPPITLGWEQACGCDTEEVVPCTVMDHFIGSGTTASVALEHGRYAIGIELKEEYLRKNAIPRIEGVCFAKPELRHLVKREVKRVDLKGKKA